MDQTSQSNVKSENGNINVICGNILKEDIDINVLIKEKISELTVPILNSIAESQLDNFKFFNERHYEDRYFVKRNKQDQYEDTCIRVHTNKLLLLSLASGNDIVLSHKDITEIDFVVNNLDRSKVKVVGKRKLGSKPIHPDTIVCRVKLKGEDEMRCVRAGVNGYLIEINESVKKNPNLLIKNPKRNGYLAIIMPKGHINDFDTNTHLISEEMYFSELEKRNKEH